MASLRTTIAVLSFLALSLTGCGIDSVSFPPPTISPGGGTFTTPQTVSITQSDKGGELRYTVDGSIPTTSSPLYKGPFQVATSLTVNAIVFLPLGPGTRGVARFNLNLPAASTPVIRPATGSFTTRQTVTITASTPAATIYYTTNGTNPTTSSKKYTAAFTVTTTTNVRAIAIATGYSVSAVAASTITINTSPAATPVISPAAGTYSTRPTVTITSATAGAAIYYTIDGSTPTAASTRYTTSFVLNTTATVKAIAIASGFINSAIAQTAFTLTGTGALSGVVQIRRNAVAGAAVRLYVAGTTGYAAAPSIISPSVFTDASGKFSLTYTCGSATGQAFLVSTTGTPAGGSAQNNYLTLVTALGPCSGIGASATVNEFTTVAAAYALAQFTDTYAGNAYARIGAPTTNATGIANAFLTANVIVNSVTGLPGGPRLTTSSTLPLAELNSLANVVSSCAATTGSSACLPLLNATTSTGANSTDSFTAIVNLALHPALNPAGVYALSIGGVFTPRLTTAPTDWTLALKHTGGGISQPTAIGIDAGGNVWIANYPGYVTRLAPFGGALSPVGGYPGGGMYELHGLTIDTAGNVWVTSQESLNTINGGNGAVQKLSSAGAILSGTAGFSAGVNIPEAAAADKLGNIWIANSGNSTVALLSSAGTLITPATGLTGTFSTPGAVATDATNGAWFANGGGSSILRVAANRTVGTAVTCCNAPAGIALDSAGNLWASNFAGDTVSEVRPTGTIVSAGYAVGSGTHPQGIAIDGANNVWVANNLSGTLAELQGETSTGTPGTLLSGTSGYGAAASLKKPQRLAIDGSGNLWVTSYGDSTSNGAVMEFVGAAAPVKTPLIGLPAKP